LFVEQGKLNEGIACYRTAIEINPQHRNAHNCLGNVFYLQGKLEEALTYQRKAIEIDPHFANAHYAAGSALRGQGKLDEALESYGKALELDPRHANAHYGVGGVLKTQGKYEEAIASYRKAIELDPRHRHAHNSMALLLATCPDPKFRDPRLAVEHAKKLIELQPHSVEFQLLGWAHYRAGDWRECIATLEESCKRQSGGKGDAGQWIVMSLAHWKLSNDKNLPEEERSRHQEEARRWFEQAAKDIDNWKFAGDDFARAIRAFRTESAELMGATVEQK
jgi:tetratricopeptide (TPR) repeat protein